MSTVPPLRPAQPERYPAAHGDNPRVDAAGRLQVIEQLCSFEGRGPGTDAERRAANWLAERLRRMGRRVEVEPTYVHPQYSLAIALHVALAIAGSLVALLSPAPGFALVLFAAFSLYLDQSTRFYLLRRLLFRRASQNIVSPGPSPGAPARVVLSAHYDAARTRPRLRRALGPPRPPPLRALAGAARADPPDLLGRRRAAAADLRAADGGSRRAPGSRSCSCS